MLNRRRLVREQGEAAGVQIQSINARLKEIRDDVAVQFPLNAAQVVALRENLSQHVLVIHDIEKEAISLLKDAMK